MNEVVNRVWEFLEEQNERDISIELYSNGEYITTKQLMDVDVREAGSSYIIEQVIDSKMVCITIADIRDIIEGVGQTTIKCKTITYIITDI